MNLDILETQTYSQSVAYSEPWNIQKVECIEIPVSHIAVSLENSSKL